MAATQPDLQTLVAAQGQTREQISNQVIALAAASAAGFAGWYSSAQITEWAAKLARSVQPYMRLLAQNTDAYMARAVSDVAGRRVRPIGRVDVTDLRTGVTHAGAYARAADVYRFQQSQFDQVARQINAGAVPDPPVIVEPVQAAVQRVKDVANWDTMLTVQQQSTASLVDAEQRGLITGWRRVIHPELSISGSCGLCIVVSHRAYKASDLMPVHARCNCIPVPILDGNDPGSVLNDKDLRRLYGDAGSTGRADLKRTRYGINEHGELGPVLSGKKLKDASGRRKRTAAAPMTEDERRAALERIHGQLAEALPKVRDLAHDSPRQWGKYATNLEDRVAELEQQLRAA